MEAMGSKYLPIIKTAEKEIVKDYKKSKKNVSSTSISIFNDQSNQTVSSNMAGIQGSTTTINTDLIAQPEVPDDSNNSENLIKRRRQE